jgi:hypothetical protein
VLAHAHEPPTRDALGGPSSRRTEPPAAPPARTRSHRLLRPLVTTLGAVLAILAARPASPAPPSPAPPVAPIPAPAPELRGGYWLGADLVGPAAAQQGAATELGTGLLLQEPADVAPPGVLVGHVSDAQQALQWIGEHAFEPTTELPPEPRALQRGPAPAPAGGLLERHGALLVAFIVSGATPELRPREIDWPSDQATLLPIGSTWVPAALVPEKAPLFAAPAPTIPPAAERHAIAYRRGGLYLLGWVDRCDDHGRCLRWAQVVARDDDRFTPGYVPMVQVARVDAWVPSASTLPRAQLVPMGLAGDRAQWVLLARGRDNLLHRRTLTAATTEAAWPDSGIVVTGELAIVTLGELPPLHLQLDATLDARPPEADEEPDEGPLPWP